MEHNATQFICGHSGLLLSGGGVPSPIGGLIRHYEVAGATAGAPECFRGWRRTALHPMAWRKVLKRSTPHGEDSIDSGSRGVSPKRPSGRRLDRGVDEPDAREMTNRWIGRADAGHAGSADRHVASVLDGTPPGAPQQLSTLERRGISPFSPSGPRWGLQSRDGGQPVRLVAQSPSALVLTGPLVDPGRTLPLVHLGADQALDVLVRELTARRRPGTDSDRRLLQRQAAVVMVLDRNRFGVVEGGEGGTQHRQQRNIPLLERGGGRCAQAVSHVQRHRSETTVHAV